MPVISSYRIPKNAKKEDIEKKFGGKFKWITALARIGSGTKVHKVAVDALKTKDGLIIWRANSWCGSQKWSLYGRSQLYILDSLDQKYITCDRCLGRRVKGGKSEPPATKRPKIDPMSRPRSFKWRFKAKYNPEWRGHVVEKVSDIKGMTEEEAWARLVKRDTGKGKWFEKVYDRELLAIYAWNGRPLWKKVK